MVGVWRVNDRSIKEEVKIFESMFVGCLGEGMVEGDLFEVDLIW